MALSDLMVRQAKTNGKTYTLPDIDGPPDRMDAEVLARCDSSVLRGLT